MGLRQTEGLVRIAIRKHACSSVITFIYWTTIDHRGYLMILVDKSYGAYRREYY